MSDHGREKFGAVARRFNYLDAGPAGREVRPYDPAERNPFAAEPQPHAGPGSTYFGLEDLYAEPPKPWSAIFDAGNGTAQRGAAFNSQDVGPQGGDVGDGTHFWSTDKLSTPNRSPAVGSGLEMAWDRLALGAGLAALAMGAWALIKRYPGPAVLWTVAILAIVVL